MHRVFSVYGRKILSVSLLFNALLTITCAVSILSGFYAAYPLWKPFTPFLLDGNLFWIVIAGAIINIFPAAHVGKVHTGRLWFHHYVYGFAVMACSVAWIAFFSSVSLLNIFFVYSTDVAVNIGRFFFIGGLTLVLDDLPDVHRFTDRGVQWLKCKAHQAREIIHAVQLIMGLVAVYFVIAISLSILQDLEQLTLANAILIGTLLFTALTSFSGVGRKVWFSLAPKQKT
jgi:hypothetical protein